MTIASPGYLFNVVVAHIDNRNSYRAYRMLILRIISYTCFGLAGLGIIFALGEGEIMLMSLSVSTAIAGVLMLALDRIVTTLTEIRDTIIGYGHAEGPADTSTVQPADTNEVNKSAPTKNLEELTADIDRMKSNR